eukprot:jgi/Chrpa1/5238/Chrysochromulina_OHIO_Genome00015904-RA
MMVMATSLNTKGHAKNAENAKAAPEAAFPKEALTAAELNRWVVKPGQSVPEIVRPPLGLNVSIEGYQSSEMELTWLTGNIANGTLCDHARKPEITANAQTWVEYSSQRGVWAPGQRPAAKPTPQQTKVLSHFLVQGHQEPIEPLHGVARHPFGGFYQIPNGVPATVHNAGGISPSVPLFYRLYKDS